MLDFGLAKTLDDNVAGSNISNSPTMTMAMTRAGVRSRTQPGFGASSPAALFEAFVPAIFAGRKDYPHAVSADGKRFLINKAESHDSDAPLHVVTNWAAALQ